MGEMAGSKLTVRFVAAAASILVLTSILSSCKTVPLPNSPTESLFIIPSQLVPTLNNGQVRVVATSITIRDEATKQETTVQLPGGDSFAMVPLEPGAYDIRQIRITLQNVGGRRPWTDTHDFFGSFFIEKHVVRYYERKIYVRSRPQGWYNFGYDYTDNPEDKKSCLEQVKKDPRWLAWQNYNLVNF
jgi:hypothetical protein